jgi:two-component system, NarL family, nitrate/nitrite response regulator NarL
MTAVSLVGIDVVARAEVRRALERAGIDVVAEGTSLEDVSGHPADVQVVSADATAGDFVSAETLTVREREVLELLAEGFSNRRVAERLGISDHTVKFHVAAIYGKLGASSRAELIRRAARRGLITI